MEKNTNCSFTTNTGKVDNAAYNTNITEAINSNYWDYNGNFICQYLLPCGICSRTNNPCPKHGGSYLGDPYVHVGNSMTELVKDLSTTYTTDKCDNK